MDSMSAFGMGASATACGALQRVFDWDKAARLIVESGAKSAVAGLSSDMEWTAGQILEDGKPDLESYTFLSSNWATPVLVLDDGEEIDCWRYASETPGWDSGTKWPESAKALLLGKDGAK
jgi:hypothetical protein